VKTAVTALVLAWVFVLCAPLFALASPVQGGTEVLFVSTLNFDEPHEACHCDEAENAEAECEKSCCAVECQSLCCMKVILANDAKDPYLLRASEKINRDERLNQKTLSDNIFKPPKK